MTGSAPVRLAVVGADHPHVFQLVDSLVKVGVEAAAHTTAGDLVSAYGKWRPESRPLPLERIFGDDSIDLIVAAGIPSERADVAEAAIDAGKWVLSPKPGVTTREQLDRLSAKVSGHPRQAGNPGQAGQPGRSVRRGRPWTVLCTERFENRAVAGAIAMARDGAVGRVVHVAGSGPHSLFRDRRPDWFWDPQRSGGILVDIGAHQVDEFLAVIWPDGGLGPGAGFGAGTGVGAGPEVGASTGVGAGTGVGVGRAVEIRSASVGNVSCPDRPAMQDIGAMSLSANGVQGDLRVDYLSPAGLDSWGDVRLTITGTAGTLEARANLDVAGEPGPEHLLLVDHSGTSRVDLSGVEVDWAARLMADMADGTETLMPQAQVIDVCDITLRAQQVATRWGSQDRT